MSDQRFVHNGGPTEDALFAYVAGRLHPQAREWIEAHLGDCARCAQAVERVSSLHEALEPPPLSPFQRQKDIAAVRRRLEARRPRPRRGLAWSAGLAFAAVALAAWFGVRRTHHTGAPVVATVELPWSVVAREGAADVAVGDDHAVVQAKATLPAGGILVVQPGARVVARWGGARVVVDGAEEGARVALLESRADQRRVRLERGRIVLDVDPLHAGETLAVETADDQVTVHGTVFAVARSQAGTSVAVDRGRVRVAGRARSVDIAAGHRLAPGATAAAPLLDEDKAVLSLVENLPPLDGVTETLDIIADVPRAEVSVDGLGRGHAPLSLAVAPGVHHVRVTAPGRVPVEERVEVIGGTPALFRAELLKSGFDDAASPAHAHATPPHAEPAPAAHPHARAAEPTDKDPMEAARADVMAGEYGRAVDRLERLRKQPLDATQTQRALLLEAQAYRLALKPERAVPLLEKVSQGAGPEAEQGTMMLAQTLQRDLADPHRAAVVWAQAEQRFPKGIFREEVAFRLGESLIAAGQPREGVEALERFLKAFPQAGHAEDTHLLIAAARRDRLSDCAGAIPHLRAVAEGPRGLHTPRAEAALIGEARCLQQVGRSDEARATYQRYLDQLPRGRFADEARQALAQARHK